MRAALLLTAALAFLTAPAGSSSEPQAAADDWREHVAAPNTWAPDPWEFDRAQCGTDDSACAGFSLGNHRAEFRVGCASASSTALAGTLRWRRRPSPAWNPATPETADFGTVVVTWSPSVGAAEEHHPVSNFTVLNATAAAAVLVFEPSFGPGLYCAYYLPYNFSGGSGAYQSVFGPPPRAPTRCAAPTGSVATAWRPNHATASDHPRVLGSSGDSWSTNAAWKAADGDLRFAGGVDCQHPAPNDECEGWNPFPGQFSVEES